ncbi:guanine nucleotide exchange factor for Rab-3A-like isoform X1 [Acipenser oxyrinchus oxyrinchus]|uniref:Guanine nucleotide exchange factor for Rab-3A-like isoform X1 n=1 Tax=Acipenser oxyrinchus oxyrinchus TaxID=40147 RepID=A0AAD8CZK8_ACIOX|nr:guanine nucleotide exchange factor for Rab-3A-like isoform X1 [Acipenser oxyrinchus oxyrinchus]
MDSFEGLHSVTLSPGSLAPRTSLDYEILIAGETQVYSSPALFCGIRYQPPHAGASHQGYPEISAKGKEKVPDNYDSPLDLEAGSWSVSNRSAGLAGCSNATGARGSGGRGEEAASWHAAWPPLGSSVEIREKGSEILKEELHKAQKELKLKDEECERLSRVREQLEQELEELTASLFEEAHKMVREANTKQAVAEKQLREAQGKIDVLLAEVCALKMLVLTSTPSSPNREMHPQLLSPPKSVFKKGHTRNKSASSAVATAMPLPGSAAQLISRDSKEPAVPALLSLILCIVPGRAVHVTYEPCWQDEGAGPMSYLRQVDSVLFSEFLSWRVEPSLEPDSLFLQRVYREDIGPCLAFAKRELSQSVQAAVESNTLSIEPAAVQALPMVKASAIECGGPNGWRAHVVTKCALSGMSRACKHRIKLGDSGSHYYISPCSRARITAVCNFFTYIRYIQQGLVRQEDEQMYWEVMRLRKEMSMAKLGFFREDEV